MATEATEEEALVQIAAIGKTAVVSGKPAVSNGYVWPGDFSVMPQRPTMPFLFVSRMYASPVPWYRKIYGKGEHRWTAEILFAVALGDFIKMDAESAAAVVATQGWERALSDVFWANQTLNGTADGIGIATGTSTADLFTSGMGHIPIGSAWYWGLRLEMFVRQTYAQPMGP